MMQSSGASTDKVQGIGLTGQMHGLALLDDDNNVLRPVLLWNDQRTGSQCDDIRIVVYNRKVSKTFTSDLSKSV